MNKRELLRKYGDVTQIPKEIMEKEMKKQDELIKERIIKMKGGIFKNE